MLTRFVISNSSGLRAGGLITYRSGPHREHVCSRLGLRSQIGYNGGREVTPGSGRASVARPSFSGPTVGSPSTRTGLESMGDVGAVGLAGSSAHAIRHEALQLGMDGSVLGGQDGHPGGLTNSASTSKRCPRPCRVLAN